MRGYVLPNYPVRRVLERSAPGSGSAPEQPGFTETWHCIECGTITNEPIVCKTPVCLASLCSMSCVRRHAMGCPKVPKPPVQKSSVFDKVKKAASVSSLSGAAILAFLALIMMSGKKAEGVATKWQLLT